MFLPRLDPQAWCIGSPGRVFKAISVVLQLKDQNLCPQRIQCFFKKEGSLRVKPVINKFLSTGLLVSVVPMQYVCFTVAKSSGEYDPLQDLKVIKEEVVLIHPLVIDPYTILAHITGDTK